MEKRDMVLELGGGSGSSGAALRICLFGYLGMIVMTLLAAWLEVLWLHTAYVVVWFLLFVMEGILMPLGCRVRIEEDAVSVRFFGLTLRRMSLSAIDAIFVTEGYMDQGLCLSRLSLTETAARREKALLRNPYYRSGVSQRKSRPGWALDFAKEHIRKQRRKNMLPLRDRARIWIDFDPALMPVLRRLLPKAEVYDLRPAYHHIWRGEENARVLCGGLEPTEHLAEFHPEGIHVVRKKDRRLVYAIPAGEIRTIIRWEHYSTSRAMPTRLRMLSVSTHTVEELVQAELEGKSSGAAQWLQFPEGEAILAIRHCCRKLYRWKDYRAGFCVVSDTPEQAEALRRMCPDARWIEM